jgi:hypothetical protein
MTNLRWVCDKMQLHDPKTNE